MHFILESASVEKVGLRATFGPRSETELACADPCEKLALHTVENFF